MLLGAGALQLLLVACANIMNHEVREYSYYEKS